VARGKWKSGEITSNLATEITEKTREKTQGSLCTQWLRIAISLMILSDPFIQSALKRLDSPDVIRIGVVGSYSRAQESRYSDVDFNIFVSKLPENPYNRYTLRYWDEKLVSLSYALLDDERSALTDPRRAIWAVPGLRGMKILLDKDESMKELQKAAQEFDWSPLQPAADELAAEEVMGCAEEVHKILNGLVRGHESTVLYAIWGLVKNMLEAVAVQKGLMIVSENRYFDLIQDSVGRDSKWTRAFRTAWGLDPTASQYQSRGIAALTLYRLTALMFDGLIPEKHRDVVNRTLQLIKEVGYS
jgi:hypothetical protein